MSMVSRPKVMVAGCFDLLHASHLVFLTKAAALGELYVSLGSDQSIVHQKGKLPAYTEQERRYLLENLRIVHWVGVVSDPGPLGFVEHLDEIQPDIFVVNADGDTPEKRAICQERRIVYRVFPRDRFNPNRPTSSTEIAREDRLPTRVSLCSGYIDQPVFNSRTTTGGGRLVVLSIEGFVGLRERSGLATSTRNTVRRYFGNRLPSIYTPDTLAEIIFCLENPPHRRGYISGSLDARGIVGFGASLFTYSAGSFLPAAIEQRQDEATLAWLEEHVYLRHAWERPVGLAVRPLTDADSFPAWVKDMDAASFDCWEAIKRHDFLGLADAINRSHRAQAAAVENYCPPDLHAFIACEPAAAAMVMGAGGGGYVAFLAGRVPADAIRICIRRSDY
jgi:cytidyltransferase-like protein